MSYRPFDLTGKVALVTGGNAGIGLGMARALAEAGAAICIWGTRADKNAVAAREIEALGVDTLALECDVGDREQVEAAFAATLERFGRVDACFANAGVSGWQRSFLDITPDEWRRVLRVNLDGALGSSAPRPATRAVAWWPPEASRPSPAPRATSTTPRPRAAWCRWCARWPSSSPATGSPRT